MLRAISIRVPPETQIIYKFIILTKHYKIVDYNIWNEKCEPKIFGFEIWRIKRKEKKIASRSRW